jgi:hypothetical protein
MRVRRIAVLATDVARRAEEVILGSHVPRWMHALKVTPPPFLTLEFAQARTLPIFPATKRNRRSIKDARTSAMSISFCLSFHFPVN